MFITVLRSEQLKNYALEKDLQKKEEKWIKCMERKKSKISEDQSDSYASKSLKEIGLFKGFDNEIEALGFNNLQHIYDELQYLADAFQMP